MVTHIHTFRNKLICTNTHSRIPNICESTKLLSCEYNYVHFDDEFPQNTVWILSKTVFTRVIWITKSFWCDDKVHLHVEAKSYFLTGCVSASDWSIMYLYVFGCIYMNGFRGSNNVKYWRKISGKFVCYLSFVQFQCILAPMNWLFEYANRCKLLQNRLIHSL